MAKRIKSPAMAEALAKLAADPSSVRFYVGLDVAVKSTAVCVLDQDGGVIHEVSMKTHPTEISRYLRKNFQSNIARIGMESGGLAGWLYNGLKKEKLPVVVLDAYQVHRVLSVKRNKTDANDARGIAELVRTGRDYMTSVYVKSAACYEIRALLTIRNKLVGQRLQSENMVRGIVRANGGRIEPGAKTAETFRERTLRELTLIRADGGIDLRPRLIPVLDICEQLHASAGRIGAELTALAQADPICRRFMEVPGVGPIVAISFFTAIEDPGRFRRASDVAAYLGLTPRTYQSGESLSTGRISKMGNTLTRTHLIQAATVLLSSSKKWSSLKHWGIRLSKRVGFNKAKVAVARKLAMILFSLWRDGTHFRFKQAEVAGHRALMARARA